MGIPGFMQIDEDVHRARLVQEALPEVPPPKDLPDDVFLKLAVTLQEMLNLGKTSDESLRPLLMESVEYKHMSDWDSSNYTLLTPTSRIVFPTKLRFKKVVVGVSMVH